MYEWQKSKRSNLTSGQVPPPGPFSEEIQFDQGSSSEPRICPASQHLPLTMYFYKCLTFYTILAETVSSELAVDCEERCHFAALEVSEKE